MKLKKQSILIKRLILIFFFLVLSISCSDDKNKNKFSPSDHSTYPLLSESYVKNVILFIGDGMGAAHVTATRINYKGVRGRLNMERMPVVSLVDTFTADGQVTDSSAAATALASGIKTNRGFISITPDGKKALTIAEACRDQGKATGIVVTCSLTQSTPAAFASHVRSRWDAPLIASQLVNSRINIMLGGGRSHFLPQSHTDSRRKDDLDLIQKAQSNGYNYVHTIEQFNSASGNYILGLFQYDDLKFDNTEPSLAEMTKKTIQLLNRNPKGFFLMVEGSLIDRFCHRHDSEKVFDRIKHFDDAIKEALTFAMEDKRTLVVVTGDHESGGLVIDGESYGEKELKIKWVSRFHTGVPTPLFVFGPSAQLFNGLLNNTDLPKNFARLLGIKNFPSLFE